MKAALDTNFLAYAEGVNDAAKRDRAVELLQALPHDSILIPTQVMGELYNVLVRKARKPPAIAHQTLMQWQDTYPLIDTTSRVMRSAMDLATIHQFSIWDAVILSASSHAGCRFLLSEDMQDGFSWGGTTIVNPFADSLPSAFQAVLTP